MKIKRVVTAAALLIAGNSAFAVELLHPVTGDLVLDTDTAEFSSSCTNNEVSLNHDGSLDLVYNNFNVVGGSPVFDKTCQFKIDLNVPTGWVVVVSTEAAIAGNYLAPVLASFQHTLAGTTRQAAFKYYPTGADAYTIDQPYQEVGTSVCNEETMTLKTVANIVALDSGAFINVNSGSLNGETTAWRYHFDWFPC